MQEAICVLVQRRRSEMHFFQMQAMLSDGDKRVEAFDDFRNALFPFIRREVAEERERVQGVMDRMLAQGPIRIMGLKPGR